MKAAIAALALLAILAASLSAADRSHPPEPGPPRLVHLPEIQHLTLSNGLAVLLVEQHEVPTVQVTVVIGSGAAADPKDRPGVAAMTADMLDEGTGPRNALDLADAVDALGADLTADAGWDASTVGLHVPVKHLAEALPILADLVRRPTFPEPELARLRNEALTSLLESRSEPHALADAAVARAVFGEHRYGRLLSGDSTALRALTTRDLRAFHERHYRPGNATLVVVGDVQKPAIQAAAEAAFGSWPRGGTGPPALPAPPAARRVLWLVDRPGAAQSTIRVGQPGPARTAAEYHALEVASALLGGLFTSRLNDNLRETHGYAYGARSSFSYRRVAGRFVASADVHTPQTAPALTEILREIARLHDEVPTAEEAARARAYLAMGYPEELETPGQIAAELTDVVVYGLAESTIAEYVARLLAVGPDDMHRAMQDLQPDHMAIVVVGDRAKIEGPLRALGIGPVHVVSPDVVLGPAPRVD
jgi:zinc protease